MIIKKSTLIGLAILALTNNAFADNTTGLQEAREKTVMQYLLDLQKADYKDITQLFEKNGVVISTSQGNVDAKSFFYSFLPNIASASTELHDYFSNNNDQSVARFHFSFQMKQGEQEEGEYMDEFIFTKNSAKLAAVYMFENLKFKTKLHD